MTPTAEEVELLHQHEHWKALVEHEGFRLYKQHVQNAALDAWRALLTVKRDGLEAQQGFLDGLNYALEYADARVSSALEVIARIHEDDAAATQAALARDQERRARSHRTVRIGATLD